MQSHRHCRNAQISAQHIVIPVVFGFGFVQVTIEDFSVEEARKLDVCFVSVSGDFSLEHCEKMAEGEDGCVVIDNSSAFRCVSL